MGKKKNKNNPINKFISSLSSRERILIMLAVGFIIAFLIFALIRYGFGIGNTENLPVESNIVEITFEQYKEDVKSTDKKLIYVDNSSQEKYESFKEVVEQTIANREMKVSFLDLNKISDEELIGFMNQISITKESYIVPLLLVIEDGKVVDNSQGVLTDIELQDFLSRNSIGYKKVSNNE